MPQSHPLYVSLHLFEVRCTSSRFVRRAKMKRGYAHAPLFFATLLVKKVHPLSTCVRSAKPFGAPGPPSSIFFAPLVHRVHCACAKNRRVMQYTGGHTASLVPVHRRVSRSVRRWKGDASSFLHRRCTTRRVHSAALQRTHAPTVLLRTKCIIIFFFTLKIP